MNSADSTPSSSSVAVGETEGDAASPEGIDTPTHTNMCVDNNNNDNINNTNSASTHTIDCASTSTENDSKEAENEALRLLFLEHTFSPNGVPDFPAFTPTYTAHTPLAHSPHTTHTQAHTRPPLSLVIPRFFFRGEKNCAFHRVRRLSHAQRDAQTHAMHAFFTRFPGARCPIGEEHGMQDVTRVFCGLPALLSELLAQRVLEYHQRVCEEEEKERERLSLRVRALPHTPSQSHTQSHSPPEDAHSVPWPAFLLFFEREIAPYDAEERLFRLLRPLSLSPHAAHTHREHTHAVRDSHSHSHHGVCESESERESVSESESVVTVDLHSDTPTLTHTEFSLSLSASLSDNESDHDHGTPCGITTHPSLSSLSERELHAHNTRTLAPTLSRTETETETRTATHAEAEAETETARERLTAEDLMPAVQCFVRASLPRLSRESLERSITHLHPLPHHSHNTHTHTHTHTQQACSLSLSCALATRFLVTVVARLFFSLDRQRCGSLSLRDTRRGRLCAALCRVERELQRCCGPCESETLCARDGDENNINININIQKTTAAEEDDEERSVNLLNAQETQEKALSECFSVESFFETKRIFRELNSDGNDVLQRKDLLQFDRGALSEELIERIFAVGERALSDGHLGFSPFLSPGLTETQRREREQESEEDNGMNFADFLFFYFSFSQRSPFAARYWLRCLDLSPPSLPHTHGHTHHTTHMPPPTYFTETHIPHSAQDARLASTHFPTHSHPHTHVHVDDTHHTETETDTAESSLSLSRSDALHWYVAQAERCRVSASCESGDSDKDGEAFWEHLLSVVGLDRETERVTLEEFVSAEAGEFLEVLINSHVFLEYHKKFCT